MAAIFAACMGLSTPGAAQDGPGAASAEAAMPHASTLEISAQARRDTRRRKTRPRITVRPRPRDVRGMRRECAAVFEERYIPQWGGNVLYANRRCWWVPG